MTRPALPILFLAIGLAATSARAQPTPPPSDDAPLSGPEHDAQDGEPTREEVRRTLEVRLELVERYRDRLRGTLERIESGAEVEPRTLERLRRFGERMDGEPGRDGVREGFRGRQRDAMRDRGSDSPDRGPITEEEKTRALEFLKTHDPQMHERFEAMRERRPDLADRLLDRHAPRVLELIELRERDPDLFERRLRAMQSFGEIREVVTDAIAEGTLDSPETREKLRELVALRLDHEEARHEREIEELSDRLQALRAELRENRDNREALINAAVGRIIERAEYFRERFEESDTSETG